jgi:hypothetical protein
MRLMIRRKRERNIRYVEEQNYASSESECHSFPHHLHIPHSDSYLFSYSHFLSQMSLCHLNLPVMIFLFFPLPLSHIDTSFLTLTNYLIISFSCYIYFSIPHFLSVLFLLFTSLYTYYLFCPPPFSFICFSFIMSLISKLLSLPTSFPLYILFIISVSFIFSSLTYCISLHNPISHNLFPPSLT